MKKGNINLCHSTMTPMPGSLCLLRAIWQVNVDHSYHVAYRGIAGPRLLIRTVKGKGSIRLKNGECCCCEPDSLVILDSEAISEYGTEGERWQFFWFEFTGGEAVKLPVRLRIPGRVWEIPFFYQLQTHLDAGNELAARAASELFGGYLLNLPAEELRWRQRDPRIVELLEYINEQAPHTPPVSELARRFGVCERQFRNIFQQATGSSPKQYCNALRMQQAQHMLRSTSLSVKEISEMLRFANQFIFCAAFRKAFDLSPSGFRERNRAPADETAQCRILSGRHD